MPHVIFLLDSLIAATAFFMAYKVFKQIPDYGSALFVSSYFAVGGCVMAYVAYGSLAH
jgi:hypothetical protein